MPGGQLVKEKQYVYLVPLSCYSSLMTLDAINVVEIFVNGKITFLFLNATGHDTVRETMEELEMKGT